jgi:hypothetical protein
MKRFKTLFNCLFKYQNLSDEVKKPIRKMQFCKPKDAYWHNQSPFKPAFEPAGQKSACSIRKRTYSLMKITLSNSLKCKSPVTTFPFLDRAKHKTMESASPQPFSFLFNSISIRPASIAISKSKSTI